MFDLPPFPGARLSALPRTRGQTPSADDVAEALDIMRVHRVGGRFWGAWSDVPHLGAVSVPEAADPWHVFAQAQAISVSADDPMALLAAIAGTPLYIEGQGRFESLSTNTSEHNLVDLMRRHIVAETQFLDPFTQAPISLTELVSYLCHWRALIDANRPIKAALGFAFWKQETAAPLLWAGADVPFRTTLDDLAAGDMVATWSSRMPAGAEEEIARRGLARMEVEDGFIRSAGLGADCVPPLSIVVDRLGIYFDPSGPSALESLIEAGGFSEAVLARARDVRAMIVERGLSKYDTGRGAVDRPGGERRHVLVTGQVEDDRSVLSGGGDVRSNLELLRRARLREPDAYLIYKPHPDVEAGHRKGHIPDAEALRYADQIVRDAGISPLLAMVDHVHVLTSLAGFEALLRDKPVTTHGAPFYAGWGLTEDLGQIPARRTARRSLDELVAAALLLYPRYLDPQTGLPCTADILVKRLAEGRVPPTGWLVRLRRMQGRLHLLGQRIKGAL